MKLSAFVKSIGSRLERSKLLEDIELTKQALTENTMPQFESYVKMVGGTPERNLHPTVAKRERIFQTNVRTRESMYTSIYRLLPVTLKWIEFVEEQIRDVKSDDISVDGISYERATVLRLYYSLQSFVNYSRQLLVEKLSLNAGESVPYTKAQMLQLDQNFAGYTQFASVLSKYGNKDLGRILREIPDIEVDLNDNSVSEQTFGHERLDPMRLNAMKLNFNGSPFWWIGRWVAERQVKKYDSTVEEAKIIDLRLDQMKREKENNPDAHSDKMIEYTEKRLRDLNAEVRRMEEKYGW